MNRRLIVPALALVAVLAAVAGVRLYASSSPEIGLASADGDLACSVKPSCGAGEVALFKMSGLDNAHAGTADASAYPYTVCCSGPEDLGATCDGSYATVLTLSGADNAHVATDGSYATQACLSAPNTTMDCSYGPSGGPGYTCVASVSRSNNAHVGDCASGYGTKVWCAAFVNTPTPTKQPDPGDTDGDGCPDVAENGPDETQGGRRDYKNPWDYFNPTGDGENRIDDVLAVINHYRVDDPPATDPYDRTLKGPNPWNTGPPDGRVRIDDVINIINQYRHDCG